MLVIDAVNEMISYVGESPIDSSDPDYTEHPLYESSVRLLNSTSEFVQSRGWWFNERQATLTPVSGAIAIPNTYLSVAVLRRGYTHDYAIRNGALFDLTDNTATINTPLDVQIIELIPFEQLPSTAARFIMLEAAKRFVSTYDGDTAKKASLKEDRDEAYALFNSDQIRNLRINVFATQSLGPILANVWYGRYVTR